MEPRAGSFIRCPGDDDVDALGDRLPCLRYHLTAAALWRAGKAPPQPGPIRRARLRVLPFDGKEPRDESERLEGLSHSFPLPHAACHAIPIRSTPPLWHHIIPHELPPSKCWVDSVLCHHPGKNNTADVGYLTSGLRRVP